MPKSCSDIGGSSSDTYVVNPTGNNEYTVFCDMQTAGGGWTLCGKYDRDNSDATPTALTQGWGRSDINPDDLGDITSFTGKDASMDCRSLIENGAQYILNVGDSDGKPSWDLISINNIESNVQSDPTNLWDSSLEDGGSTACIDDTIITYDENMVDVGTSQFGCSLGDRALNQVGGSNTMFVDNRNDGNVFSNAASSGCGGTSSDTVFWCWPDESSGGSVCGYACCSTNIGTGCSTTVRPTHRYNLMFMK